MTAAAETVPLIASAVTFLVTLLLFVGLYFYYRQYSAKRTFVEKVRSSTGKGGPIEIEKVPFSSDQKVRTPVFKFLSRIGGRVAPVESEDYDRLKRRLITGGVRKPNASIVFWGTKCFLVLLFPFLFFVAELLFGRFVNTNIETGSYLLLTLAGFYLPDLWLYSRIQRRQDEIRKGLPDALDLLVVCVEAGMGLDSAIGRVAGEITLTHKTLGEELKLYGLEQRAGKSREASLKSLGARVDMEDVDSLVSLLAQTDKFGTSLAQALRVYSDTFRTKRYMRAEEIASKLGAKLLFPLILFIFPSLFVAILGPAVVSLMGTTMP
jgi:tight adherence protein C